MADVHICDECGKRLATLGGLEIHMEMSHGAAAVPPHAEPGDLEPIGSVDRFDGQPAMTPAPWPPTAPAAVAGPPRPPRKPFLGGIDPAEPLAWVLTVLLFLGGVGAAVHRPHPPSDTNPVVPSVSQPVR
jgi:hypothetical protein